MVLMMDKLGEKIRRRSIQSSRSGQRGSRLLLGLSSLLAAVLFLAGCARDVHPYPSAWPQLLPGGDCQFLLGTYENEGEASGMRKGTLFAILAFQEFPGRDRATRWVTLSMPAVGVLEARDSVEGLRFLANKGEFKCEGGMLQVWRAGGTTGHVGASWGTVTVDLSKDADGWLVVRLDESALALLGYVIPAHVSDVAWYRFRPTAPTP